MNEKHPKILVLFILLACLFGFIILANMAYQHHLLSIDMSIARDASKHIVEPLRSILQLISLPGNIVVVVVSIIGAASFFWIKNYRREALFMLAAGGADALSLIVKHIINRPGPQHIGVAVAQSSEATFPSSHIVHYVVFFGLLSFFMFGLKKLSVKLRITVSIISFGLIFAIPFSRILLAEHWVSDVLSGALLGVMSLIVLIWLYSADWFLPRLKKRFLAVNE